MFAQVHFAGSDPSSSPFDDEYRLPNTSPAVDDEYALPRTSPVDSEYSLPRSSSEFSHSPQGVGASAPRMPYAVLPPSPQSSEEYALPAVVSYVPPGRMVSFVLDEALQLQVFLKTAASGASGVRYRPATHPAVPILTVRFLPWVWHITGTGSPLAQGGRAVTVGDVVDSLRTSLNKRVRRAEYEGEDQERQDVIRTIFLSRVQDNPVLYSDGLLRKDFLEGRDILGFQVHGDPGTVELLLSAA